MLALRAWLLDGWKGFGASTWGNKEPHLIPVVTPRLCSCGFVCSGEVRGGLLCPHCCHQTAGTANGGEGELHTKLVKNLLQVGLQLCSLILNPPFFHCPSARHSHPASPTAEAFLQQISSKGKKQREFYIFCHCTAAEQPPSPAVRAFASLASLPASSQAAIARRSIFGMCWDGTESLPRVNCPAFPKDGCSMLGKLSWEAGCWDAHPCGSHTL